MSSVRFEIKFKKKKKLGQDNKKESRCERANVCTVENLWYGLCVKLYLSWRTAARLACQGGVFEFLNMYTTFLNR